jgi:glycoside/pentoside/hexuronide:cation symporter, GPH family
MTENGKLPIGVKLGFGVCDLGGNLFFTATAFVLLNFLTDTVGLMAGLAGTALMIGRIWDAFYDPVIGYASDRTRSRWGRRRPYMFIGSFPLLVAVILMFTNPALIAGEGWDGASNQATLFVWATIVYIVLCTAYSTVNIPYSSLTPELTRDFNERTSLNGYRFGFAGLGTLLGGGASLPIVALFADRSVGFAFMGVIFGVVMMVTALITVFTVREPATPPAKGMGFIKNYLAVFKNGPYLYILFAYVLHIMAITIVSGIAIYYFKYIMGDESKTGIALPILIVTALLFIPVSVLLSKKTGKKFVYGAGFVIIATICMVLFLFGHRLHVNFTLAMMVVMGVGFGFTYAMPYAIVPDAIEYDYLRTGERREGAFYGIWTWALKIGQALSVFIMGWFLTLSGYVKNAATQSDAAQMAIRLFLGPVPAAIFILGAVVLYFYPITEDKYREIMEGIKKMEEKQGRAHG